MPTSDFLCRLYQGMFSDSHAEEGELIRLHAEGSRNGRLDEFLSASFAHEYEKGLKVIDRFSGITSEWVGGRALDFGAGAGGLPCRLSESVREVVVVDTDKSKLDFGRTEARRRGLPNVDFIHYDGRAPIALETGSFDCVFCIDVVEHLPTPDMFLAEFKRLLRPNGLLLLSFGPPWGHAHGKHMWTALPGWWTHLLFPRTTVMRVLGKPEDTTYEALGLYRLTVEHYERIMRRSGFETLYERAHIMKPLTPFKYVPGLRSLLISEVVGVYRNPS